MRARSRVEGASSQADLKDQSPFPDFLLPFEPHVSGHEAPVTAAYGRQVYVL